MGIGCWTDCKDGMPPMMLVVIGEYKDECNLEGNGGSEQGAYYEMNEDKYELVDWL